MPCPQYLRFQAPQPMSMLCMCVASPDTTSCLRSSLVLSDLSLTPSSRCRTQLAFVITQCCYCILKHSLARHQIACFDGAWYRSATALLLFLSFLKEIKLGEGLHLISLAGRCRRRVCLPVPLVLLLLLRSINMRSFRLSPKPCLRR